jgi:hypothetical protein
MEAWRAAVPRSRGAPKSRPVSRRRRSGRPPGDRPAMAHPLVATMIGGGLEGCGPSQPRCAEINTGFTAPTERTPSRESASNVPSVGGNDVRWRPGGLRSLAAVAGPGLTPLQRRRTERTPSRESASNVPRVVATKTDGSASNGVHADLT